MFLRSNNTLAIDLAPDAVHILDLHFRKDGPRVTALASESLASGTAQNLPDRHLDALATLLNKNRLNGRRCLALLPTNLVLTRSLAIDGGKPLTPAEQVRMTLQNCVSFDAADLLFDFWTVAEASARNRLQEVLVVATQASVVNRYLAGLKRMHLECAHLDVAPCALASVVLRLASTSDVMAGSIVLCAQIGYFAVLQRGNVLFWRPFELPGNIARGGPLTAGVLDRIGDEISKCVSHMVGSNQLDNLNEIFVFGDSAADPEVADCLANRFGLPVHAPSPFDTLAPGAMSRELRETMQPVAASRYAAALGLALQPAGANGHG